MRVDQAALLLVKQCLRIRSALAHPRHRFGIFGAALELFSASASSLAVQQLLPSRESNTPRARRYVRQPTQMRACAAPYAAVAGRVTLRPRRHLIPATRN